MSRYALTASVFALMASPALADLTPEVVWQDWQAYAKSSGYSIAATEEMRGGDLVVSDIVLTITVEDENDMTVDYGAYEVTLRAQDDGAVAIGLSDQTTMTIDFIDPDDGPVSAKLDVSQTGASMMASGEPDAISYDYAADTLAMALAGIETNGVILTDEVAKFTANITEFAYSASSTIGDMREMEQAMTIGNVAYDIAFDDPVSDDTFAITGQMQGLTLGGAGNLPLAADGNDVNAMLNDGLAFDGTFSTSGGEYTMTFNGVDGSGTVNGVSDAGATLRVAMDPSGLVYELAQRALSVNALFSDLPIPMSFNMDEAITALRIPVQKAEDPQDFSLLVKLAGFEMSDMLWAMFDGAGQLPRDAANVTVDLSGKARLLFDYLDPAQAAVLEDSEAIPGEIDALTLNALEMDMVGAKLTGAGDFIFDNSDLETFDGIPRPEGAVDLQLVGGNGLLDKLVGMGFVPEDQAMSTRMMMGLFAVPGEGEDTLNSRIEINAEGHVSANGQRLR